MAGAFGTGRPDVGSRPGRSGSSPGSSQDDQLATFQDRLKQLSGTPDKMPNPTPGSSPGLSPGSSHIPNPQSERANTLSSMDRLRSMVASRTKAEESVLGRTKDNSTSGRSGSSAVAPPKGEFVAGQRPSPTGPTAHEVMTKPEHQERLKGVIGDIEKANPGRSLKGTHLMNAWNAKHPDQPLNEARARTVVAKVKAARDAYAQKQVSQLLRQGALKATLKK